MGPDASLFHLHNNAPASLCALPPLPPVLPFKSLKILSHFLVLQSTKTIIVSLHSTCKERERELVTVGAAAEIEIIDF